MKDKSLKSKIKEMEATKRSVVQEPVSSEEKMSFDYWWIMLSKRMTLRPSLKEILWADFNARGLKKEELPSKYEEGLKLFGL